VDVLDGLSDTISGQSVAQEKRKLADLEDEVCRRIIKIVAIANENNSNKNRKEESDGSAHLDACRTLLFRDKGKREERKSDGFLHDVPPIEDLSFHLFKRFEICHAVIHETEQAMDQPMELVMDNDGMYPAQTQPDPPMTGEATNEDNEIDCNNEDLLRASRAEESQNSLRRKASAAEALAVLALSNHANFSTTTAPNVPVDTNSA
jgi:hypothetical protein